MRQEIKSMGATYIMECLMVDMMEDTVNNIIKYFNEVYKTAPTINEIRAILNRVLQSHSDYIISDIEPLYPQELVQCEQMIKNDKERIDKLNFLKVTDQMIKERVDAKQIFIQNKD